MIILGLKRLHVDFSAALVRDGKLIAAAEDEIPSYKALGGISFAGDRLLFEWSRHQALGSRRL